MERVLSGGNEAAQEKAEWTRRLLVTQGCSLATRRGDFRLGEYSMPQQSERYFEVVSCPLSSAGALDLHCEQQSQVTLPIILIFLTCIAVMDHDETMTTSTSSTPSALQDIIDADEGYEDDNLFPDSTNDITSNNRPQTPANDHLNAAAPGELSPPRSQPQPEGTSQQHTLQSIPNGGHVAANTSATRSSARVAAIDAKFEAQREDPNAAPSLEERDERSGWGWRNRKAQEEMQRAWDSVVDRDFSLKEFGDVVLQGKAQMGQT